MWKKILVQDTLERVVCIFLVSKFRIPKTLYLSDGEAENIQWYLKEKLPPLNRVPNDIK